MIEYMLRSVNFIDIHLLPHSFLFEENSMVGGYVMWATGEFTA